MKSNILLGTLMGVLMVRVAFGHGGEVHGEKKAAAPTTWNRPAATLGVTRWQGRAGGYRLKLTVSPGKPLPGETVDLTLQVDKKLAVADPLLGEIAPYEKNTLPVEVNGQRQTLKNDGMGGGFSFHAQVPSKGDLPLSAVLPGGATALFDVPVLQPPADRRVTGLRLLLTGAGLLVWLLALVLGLRRGRVAKALVESAVLGGLSAGVFYGAFWVAATYFLPPFDQSWVQQQMAQASSPEATGETKAAAVDWQALGVRTRVLRVSRSPQILRVNGQVVTPPGATHEVHSPVEGVLKVAGRFALGQRVRAGQTLATVTQVLETSAALDVDMARWEAAKSSAELDAAALEKRGELQQTLTGLAFAEAELSRSRALLALQAVAARDVQEKQLAVDTLRLSVASLRELARRLEASPRATPPRSAAQAAKTFVLRSPISGVLSQVDAVNGEFAGPDKTLFTVVDDTAVWVAAQVLERDAPHLRTGMAARVMHDAAPGKVFTARLKVLDPGTDPATRTLKAYFVLPGKPAVLRPGGLARLELLLPRQEERLFVPEKAVVQGEAGPVVFVRTGEGFKPVAVDLGPPETGGLPVFSGLAEGQEIAVEGVGLLREQQ